MIKVIFYFSQYNAESIKGKVTLNKIILLKSYCA